MVSSVAMYICSCNGLTDHDVRDAACHGATRPGEVYAHRQCRAQCGNCAPTVLCLLREAIAAAHLNAHPAMQGRVAHA